MNQHQHYLRTLVNSHRIRVVVKLFDRNEDYLGQVERNVISGQVDVDVHRDIERTLSLTIADTRKRFSFDDGDENSAIYADKFIGVEYAVWVKALEEWHVEPVFFGPITRYEHDGFQISIEAQDKSALYFDPIVWGHYLRNAGLGNIDEDTKYAARMMRAILDAAGEDRTKLEFDDFSGARLPKDFKLPKQPESVWQVLKRIVRAANSRTGDDHYHDYRLYFDGRGRLRVDSMSTGGFTFSDDADRGVLMSKPQVSYDLSTFRNTVVVKVDRGQGGRQVVPVARSLAKHHPLSPYSLRRNGVKRYIVEEENNGTIRTREQAAQLAQTRLRQLSTESVEVRFESLPLPHLVPGARCKLLEDDNAHHFTLDQFTLPLNASGVMSVGYLKNVSLGPFATRKVYLPPRAVKR